MDGEGVLVANQDELTRGLRLQGIPNSPGYKQSQELALLNALRNDTACRPYRDLQGKMEGARKKFAEDAAGLAAFRASIEGELDRLQRKASAIEKQIHQIAVPKPYRLEVRRLSE